MDSKLSIDTDRVVEDTIDLVRIDSQNPGALETECISWLQRRLEEMGLEVVGQPVANGRENLVSSIPGRGEAPRLVLSAHVDTVPVGPDWTVPPLEGVVRDGRIYGRGSADMKSGLAVTLGTMEALTKSGPPSGDVVLALTVDEEGPEMAGVHKLVEEGFVGTYDQVLALEPTGLRLRIAQVGLRWLKVTIHGRMAHAGRAPLGVDANHVMARAVERLKSRVAALPHEDPLLGRPLFTCGVISGGVATNVVPGKCEAQFDLRLVPPMGAGETVDMVREVLEETVAGFEGAEYEIEPLGVARPPVRASESSPIVERLLEAYRTVTGEELESGGADGHEAYTDASMLSALTGSQSCTVFGPGSSDQAHTSDEYVPISDIETACRVMERLVQEW